ncbi:MAG: L,D-transpeptidase [Myxococcales bacterium]|nr:L,D-transpeptidase [Myxococcales bacterium]
MRRVLVVVCCLPLACGDALVVSAGEDAEIVATAPPEVAPPPPPVAPPRPRVRPEPARLPEPPPPPEPVDPEAEARAAAEAARRAFEAKFPSYGVTYHFLARVRAEPRQDAAVVGYMRRGSTFRASERVPGVGCARGWHEVPGEGFVCRGEGFIIGREPQTFEPAPHPPSLEDALPYPYAYAARGDIAQYWHLPSVADEATTARAFEALSRRVARERAEAAATDEVAADVADEAEAPPAPGSEGAAVAPSEGRTDPSLVAAARGEVTVPSFVRLRMQRGFYVSLDGEERDGARSFYRTVRGAYVRSESLVSPEPSTHRGVVIGGAWQLPIGFVYRGGARRLRRDPATNRFFEDGSVERLSPLIVADTVDRGSHDYVVTPDGEIIRRSAVRVARPRARPAEIGPDERWLHVDLREQILVAYEGDRAAFATMVSTGRAGFETPTGMFRIASKHVSTTMDDLDAGDESYLIEDVPWTMYFEGNYAIHAAFWHSSFGHVRSHGCVNLAPADARWVFHFAGPDLPTSWHGVFSRHRRAGTWVVVTRD